MCKKQAPFSGIPFFVWIAWHRGMLFLWPGKRPCQEVDRPVANQLPHCDRFTYVRGTGPFRSALSTYEEVSTIEFYVKIRVRNGSRQNAFSLAPLPCWASVGILRSTRTPKTTVDPTLKRRRVDAIFACCRIADSQIKSRDVLTAVEFRYLTGSLSHQMKAEV
jgi:hypothetical protein